MSEEDVELQQLEDLEDFEGLTPGDIVPTAHEGTEVEVKTQEYVELMAAQNMLVSRDTTLLKEGLMLIRRFSPDTIYRVSLTRDKVRIEEGKLKFDYTKGEGICIFGDRDWVHYDVYMAELEKAGLE